MVVIKTENLGKVYGKKNNNLEQLNEFLDK